MSEKALSFEEALALEYQEPAQVTPSPAEEGTQPPIQTLPPDPVNEPKPAGQEWVGNPDYFQEGHPRAGERRKRKARTPIATYETREGDSVVGGELITGAMFISIIDLLLPAVIVTINNFITEPKHHMKITDMQLGDEVTAKLKPLAESTLRRIKLRGDPMTWLFLTMAGMYAYRYGQVHFERKLKEAMDEKGKNKDQ